MVAPGRVELPTFGLGNRCSIHLSYGATPDLSYSFYKNYITRALMGIGCFGVTLVSFNADSSFDIAACASPLTVLM